MKLLKSHQLAMLTLVLLICGCSEELPKPSDELPMRNPLPASGENWWDVSLPKDFDAKTTEGVWLVIRDFNGSIIGHSAVVRSPDMNESVRVVIQCETDSGSIIANVTDLKGTGATLPIVLSTELDLLEIRSSSTRVNMGDTLVKWKIKEFLEEENTHNPAPRDTIQEDEASLSLEEYQHKD